MGEHIHIISRVSFDVIKIQVPIIWQGFPLKNTESPNAAAVLKWRKNLRLHVAGNVGISDLWGKPKPFFQAIVRPLKTKIVLQMLQFS